MSKRLFGLIGKSLTHSFSKNYFNQKFKREGLNNCLYDNYEIKNELELEQLLSSSKCIGLNVTIPYKEAVLPYLEEIDSNAKEIGSINTIKLYPSGIKKGFNTDYIGFIKSLSDGELDSLDKALILGSGGASKAICMALESLNISCSIVSRESPNASYNYQDLDQEIINNHLLIVNCTPIGMYPNVENAPAIPYDSIGKNHFIYDLIYNPELTLFLQRASARGARIKNGLEMLKAQAEESWKIWNDDTI